MITEQQAKLLANKVITEYINQCRCSNDEDATNALAKLILLSGHLLCAVSSVKNATIDLREIADFLEKENPTFNRHTMQ